jgi:hypothetical protein
MFCKKSNHHIGNCFARIALDDQVVTSKSGGNGGGKLPANPPHQKQDKDKKKRDKKGKEKSKEVSFAKANAKTAVAVLENNNIPIDGNYSSWGGYNSGDEAVMQQITIGHANRFSVFGEDLDLGEAWGEDSSEDTDDASDSGSEDNANKDAPAVEGAGIAHENATATEATVEDAPSTVNKEAVSEDEVSGIISLTNSDTGGSEDEGESEHAMSVVEDNVSFAGSNPEFDEDEEDGSSVTDNTSVASSNGSITSEEDAEDVLPEEASMEEEDEEVVMAMAGQHYIMDTIQSMDESTVVNSPDRDALPSSPSSQDTNNSSYFGPYRQRGTPPIPQGSMSDLPPPAYTQFRPEYTYDHKALRYEDLRFVNGAANVFSDYKREGHWFSSVHSRPLPQLEYLDTPTGFRSYPLDGVRRFFPVHHGQEGEVPNDSSMFKRCPAPLMYRAEALEAVYGLRGVNENYAEVDHSVHVMKRFLKVSGMSKPQHPPTRLPLAVEKVESMRKNILAQALQPNMGLDHVTLKFNALTSKMLRECDELTSVLADPLRRQRINRWYELMELDPLAADAAVDELREAENIIEDLLMDQPEDTQRELTSLVAAEFKRASIDYLAEEAFQSVQFSFRGRARTALKFGIPFQSGPLPVVQSRPLYAPGFQAHALMGWAGDFTAEEKMNNSILDSGASLCLFRPGTTFKKVDRKPKPLQVKDANGRVTKATVTGCYNDLIRHAAIIPTLDIGLLSMSYLNNLGYQTYYDGPNLTMYHSNGHIIPSRVVKGLYLVSHEALSAAHPDGRACTEGA